MKARSAVTGACLVLAMFLTLGATAATAGGGKDKDEKEAATPGASAAHTLQDDNMRFEGEKRFHANCGRCHAAPTKFPPRMAATILRHMRVRATITEDDMRLILRYMTQ